MLKKITIALGLFGGSILAAWGASSTLSGLSAGGAISGTDLFYDVQTPGVGGVKVTGTQLLNFVFGSVTGNCGASPSGVFTCSSLATNTMTSIAAGTNITTSGMATNTTVNVIATPTFTSITTTLASVTGWLTAAGVNMQTATIAGNLIGSTANFSGNLTGTTAKLSGNLTGTTAQFSGLLTGTNAVFQTITINSLTPTGPNCLQETGGVIQSTNTSCSSGAGTPGGSNTQVQFNNSSAFGGDPGFTFTTPAAVIITTGIITTSNKALSIFQTWNSSGQAFDAPLFMNITNTASSNSSAFIDFQMNGNSVFNIRPNGFGAGFAQIYFNQSSPSTGNFWSASDASGNVYFNASTTLRLRLGNNDVLVAGSNGAHTALTSQSDTYWGFTDTSIFRDSAVGTLALADNASPGTATGFHVYNTTDQSGTNVAPTNYERGIVDWTTTTNNFTLGTQQGGTGVGRNVLIVASNTRAQTISATATTFAAAINAPAIAQLGANTTGYVCWTTGTGAISEDSTTCIASLRRLKKDIVPFTDTTAELMALKPSQFQWKNPADANQRGQQLGFVAEDVRDVDARLASYDGNGNLHGWRQDAMIAALVRGFQEQQAIIQRQQAEIDELKQGRLP